MVQFKNPQKIIDKERELQEVIALKKALIKKGTVTQIDIDNEKTK